MKRKTLSATKVVEIGDEKYTIGMISRKEFQPLVAQAADAIEAAKAVGATKEAVSSANTAATEAFREIVRLGVREHSGLQDEAGKDIPFGPDSVETYELNGILHQLGVEVINFNVLSEEERKNS